MKRDAISQVVNSTVAFRTCVSYDTVNVIAFAQKEFSEVGTVLTRDTCDDRDLVHECSSLPWYCLA